ncbi:hypothetical protein [Aquabacter cavernae]|uniref:hypothetical protein n=1 Tax=Aquabacter cavernae TaxID=2496029 RepID=UPI000F8DCE1A|nr:hypothetical protein [Aquabacter cavernae]
MNPAALVSSIGRVLVALDDDRALVAALAELETASAATRAELEARLAPPAPVLPADCSAGHTWIKSSGVTAGKLVSRRHCAVCDAAEETETTPSPGRRGGAR